MKRTGHGTTTPSCTCAVNCPSLLDNCTEVSSLPHCSGFLPNEHRQVVHPLCHMRGLHGAYAPICSLSTNDCVWLLTPCLQVEKGLKDCLNTLQRQLQRLNKWEYQVGTHVARPQFANSRY